MRVSIKGTLKKSVLGMFHNREGKERNPKTNLSLATRSCGGCECSPTMASRLERDTTVEMAFTSFISRQFESQPACIKKAVAILKFDEKYTILPLNFLRRLITVVIY